MLSKDLEGLHHQLLMAYTDSPSGVTLTPDDMSVILLRLAAMMLESLEIEKLIPPTPPEIEGDNVVNFQNAKTRRRF